MSRPTVVPRHDPSRQPLCLSPMHNDENNQPSDPSADLPQLVTTPHLDDALTLPTGVPLPDYKALAAERDALRRKLSAVDAERSQLMDNDASLRKSLEDATDRVRILETDNTHLQNKLVEKNRSLNNAIESLRQSNLHSEELDLLRHKADKADDLDARLKHHSQRLEEMGTIRQTNKDLHAEISAFRESELRMTKHVEYLESQLGRSNQRANQLSNVVDSLSNDLQDKEARYCELHEDNDTLKRKLEHVTEQLESAILQSTMSKAPTTTATYSAAPSMDVVPKTAHTSTDGTPAESLAETTNTTRHKTGSSDSDPTADEDNDGDDDDDNRVAADGEVDATQKEEETEGQFDVKAKMHVSDLLLEAIGIRVGWEDVVECMRGVMDAMQDMEQGAELEQQGAEASGEEAGMGVCGEVSNSERRMDRFRPSAEGIRRLRSSNTSSLARLRASEHSLRSEGPVRTETGSDALSRLSFVPEFGVLDEKLKAKGTESGDEFDFAANQCNVQEVKLGPGEDGGDNETVEESDEYEEEECLYTDDGEETEESLSMLKGKTGGLVEVKSSSTSGAPMIGAMIDESMQQNGEVVETEKKMSVSLTIRGLDSRSTSRSETTSVIARQTRNDLQELQRTMELMRMERQSSTSVTSLAHKLDAARVEMELMRKKMMETESESANLRREMNSMLKEMDHMTFDKETNEDCGREVVEEKERLLRHLESEVQDMRDKYEESRKQMDEMQRSERSVRDKLEAATVVERAHEVEIARLQAQVEELENVERLMNCVMQKTEEQMHTIADMTQRDKQLAEEMRDEARRVARRQVSVLEDMKASAAAAMMARAAANAADGGEQQQRMPPRQSSKFQEFFRKLLHRESRESRASQRSLERAEDGPSSDNL